MESRNRTTASFSLKGPDFDPYPGLRLYSSIIERIGFYKLSLACNFYYLYSKQREDTES